MRHGVSGKVVAEMLAVAEPGVLAVAVAVGPVAVTVSEMHLRWLSVVVAVVVGPVAVTVSEVVVVTESAARVVVAEMLIVTQTAVLA